MVNPSREYLKSLPAKKRKILAASAGVSHEYLYMIGANDRTPGRSLVAKLEVLTKKKVKAADFDKEVKQALSA